jgi:hypothetical protein
MRTTVTIADGVYKMAKEISHFSKISLGEALSYMARQGMQPGRVTIDDSGPFPVFRVPPGTKTITLEETLALKDALEAEF